MPTPKIKLLLVEDSAMDRRLFAEYLKGVTDLEFEYDYAETLAETIKKLSEKKYDVVILDLGLPDSQGISTFYELQKHYPGQTVVIMSGLGIEEVAKKAVQNGAHDYLIKGEVNATQLTKSIRFAIRRQQARAMITNGVKRITGKSPETQAKSEIKPTKAAKFIQTKTETQISDQLMGELLADYENLITHLLKNNLKNDTQSLSMIQFLAQKAHHNGVKPKGIDQLRKQQTQISTENILLFMINADIIAEMVTLLYEERSNTKVRSSEDQQSA